MENSTTGLHPDHAASSVPSPIGLRFAMLFERFQWGVPPQHEPMDGLYGWIGTDIVCRG
jgi:hypothetical protein